MTFIALHRHADLTVATDQLLVPPQDVGALNDALALAGELAQWHGSEQGRIESSRQKGYDDGHREGFTHGETTARDAAAATLAQTIATLTADAQAQHAQVRDAVLSLALLLVRRVAATVAPADMLSALITQALDHVAAEEARRRGSDDARACVVRVHPSLLNSLQERFVGNDAIQWRGDDALAPLDCVIDTPDGRLLAGLQAQLERVQAVLQEAKARATPAVSKPSEAPQAVTSE
jgi:type III secretion protein L